MVSNPGYYSQMATAGSLTQIEDGVDNPHTGLIKALSLGVAGNYVISGFDATSVTATSATIAAGVVLRDGERVAITGSGVSLSTTYTTGYHLLVARSSALAVINPAAANKVPAFTAGDVPIAILAHTGSNPMQIQYFGTGKTENSLSIAQPTSGTAAYTEEGKISAPSGASGQGIDIVTTSTNSDIRITPNGDGKIVLDGLNWPTADGTANQVLKTDGGGQLSFTTVSSNSITDADGDTKIQVEESADEDKIRFDTGGIERVIIDSTGLGIGTSAPDKELHVRGADNPTVRIQEDGQSGYIEVTSLVDSQCQINAINDSAAEASRLDINPTVASGATTAQEVRFFRNSRTTGDANVIVKQPGTNTNVMVLTADNAGSAHTMYLNGSLAVNKSSAASGVSLEVNGDVGGDKFKVESIQYELASDFTSAGAIPGPPSAPTLSLTDTDSIYRISTTVGNPPGTAALDVDLPATSGNEGLVLKIIFPAIAGAPDDLRLTVNGGSDTIIAPDNSVLAAAGAFYTLTTAGVYEAICISGSWIFYKIN